MEPRRSACDTCRRRRVRCDSAQPCRRCVQSGLACTYGSTPSRISATEYTRNLEQQIAELRTSSGITKACVLDGFSHHGVADMLRQHRLTLSRSRVGAAPTRKALLRDNTCRRYYSRATTIVSAMPHSHVSTAPLRLSTCSAPSLIAPPRACLNGRANLDEPSLPRWKHLWIFQLLVLWTG